MIHRHNFLLLPLITLLSVVLPLISIAQIPNPGFESWTSGSPDGWWVNNNAFLSLYPLTQSSTAHSGSSALYGAVTDYMSVMVSPMAAAGQTGYGFPIATRFSSFQGYYQFSPAGGDRLVIFVYLRTVDSLVGMGAIDESLSVSSYQPFSIPIEYISARTPDTAFIEIVIAPHPDSSTVHVGSTFLVDDLSFGGATGVSDHAGLPAVFRLEQNYPNPFNPATSIRYSLPSRSHVDLSVFDATGRIVTKLVDGLEEAGGHEVRWTADGLASGIYYYRLAAGSAVQIRKLTLLK